MKKLKVAIFLAYGGESHLYWANQIKNNSRHDIEIFSLPPRYWKWRMQGSGGYFADLINKYPAGSYDLFICTSMTNVNSFKSFLNKDQRDVPIYLYFHENQFSYPVSSMDPDKETERYEHYQFIQIQSALASECIYFNSEFNKKTFFLGAKKLIHRLPDKKSFLSKLFSMDAKLWPLHMDLSEYRFTEKENEIPIFIWNHRWEYDKNPQEFFDILRALQKRKKFQLIVCGKENDNKVFNTAKTDFRNEILHWGYCKSRQEYLKLLSKATHSIITSNHDFFGLSALECILSGVKTYFPDRLCYPEHFSKDIFEIISYKNKDNLISKIESCYPITDVYFELKNKFSSFNEIPLL